MRLEAGAWLYVRLSGIALLFLVIGHMFLMHILAGVNSIDFAFVTGRWTGVGWRAYDLAMLVLAMTHAVVGLRSLAFDHLSPRGRPVFLAPSYAGCVAVTLLGAWVILTFPQPL